MKPRKEIKTGSIYISNGYGKFVIVNVCGWDKILIRFIETGYEKVTNSYHVRNGSIRDPLLPNVYGVGFVGDGIYKAYENGRDTAAYSRWQSMMQRCYDDSYHEKKPTYKDCEVCEEWQNFQSFAEWFYKNYPNDGNNWQIDKDIKTIGNKIYGPEFCTFVTQKENTISAHAREWRFKSPTGDNINVYNLSKFCRENDLNQSHMWSVSRGIRKSHKGWKACGEK